MISPAIHFSGCCAEAITFYEDVFGPAAEKHIDYDREAPPDSKLVLHADVVLCGTHINMCDTTEELAASNMIMLNVFMDTADEVSAAFHKLAEDGIINVPLGAQFFSPMYGSVQDRYGVRWQLICTTEA